MDVISLIVYLVFFGVIFWLALWALGALGLPEPFNKIIHVILVVVAFVIVLNILLSLIGHPLYAVPSIRFR